MKKMTAAVALLSSLAAPALMAQESELSGFYVGGNIGLAMPKLTVEDSDCWYNCSAYTLRPNGLTYGLEVGQNFVSDNLLLGWMVDYNHAELDEDFKFAAYDDDFSDMRIGSEFRSVASARIKAGLVINKTAISLNFGPALGKFKASFVDRNGTADIPSEWDRADLDDEIDGIVWGIGIEHAFSDRFVVGVDASKYAFDNETSRVIESEGFNSGYKVQFVNDLEMARVKANFKF